MLKNDSYIEPSNLIPSRWHYAAGAYALTCFLVGLILNGCVLVMFFKCVHLRRPKYYLIINLVLADMGLLMSDTSMLVIASFTTRWPFGQIGCNLYALCGGIFGLSSIASMAVIALIRLIIVFKPFISLKLDSRIILRCLIASWFYGSIWVLPPLFGWSRFIQEGFGTSCTFDYVSKRHSDRLFMLFLMMGGFLVPLLTILISYTLILHRLHHRTRKLHNLYYSIKSSSNNSIGCVRQSRISSEISPIIVDKSIKQTWHTSRRAEIRAARRILVVCAIFCVSWGPYALATILFQFGLDFIINPYLTAALSLFAKTSACINPFIYALSSASFRQKFFSHFKSHSGTRRILHNILESRSNICSF